MSSKRLTACLRAMTVLTVASCLGAPSFAVTDEEIFRDFRFNLTNPGARSLGLGGAFIALADDATAALSNPSGLVLLSRPEVFGEIRQIDGDDTATSARIPGGRLDSSTMPDSVISPSFFSYAYPWKRVAAGISYLELTNVDNEAAASASNSGLAIVNAGSINARLSVINASGAIKILDTLSFGATVAFGRLSMEEETLDAFVIGNQSFNTLKSKIDDTDTDVAYNAGLHWQALPSLRFGAVYRGGSQFVVQESLPLNRIGSIRPNSSNAGLDHIDTTFNTPDSYGAGVAWQPLSALTLSGDWVHIKYKDLLDGLVTGLNFGVAFGRLDYTIDDADEIHVGAEYVFSGGAVPWAIRGGAYTDHNTRIYGEKTAKNTNFLGSPSAAGKVFSKRDTEYHYTIGGGVVLAQRFQIDVAASISNLVNEYVLSGIFRF